MIEYLIFPLINKDQPIGLQPIEIELPNDYSFYLFTDETNDKKGYQAFVEKYLSFVLDFKLCLIKEASAGHLGSVDFLGLDKEGKIFLIEVKKKFHDEQRGKFDVIFQSIKYSLDPKSLRSCLFGKGGQTFKSELSDKFIEIFPEKKNSITDIQNKVLENLEDYCINVLIVIDRATPQLIATAYTIFLRHTQAECRVLEMAPIKIAGKTYLYHRKYFSNNSWVDANNPDNREQLSMEDRLDQIEDIGIKKIFQDIVEICNKTDFNFHWNTEKTSYFSVYTMGSKRKPISLGIEFYTQEGKHLLSYGGNILVGSIRFEAKYGLKRFIDKHSLQVEEISWPSKPGVNYFSFTLNPDVVHQLGPNGIVKLINDYRNDLYNSCKINE